MPPQISRDELERLVDTGEVTVVETLGAQYYEDAHLPGAINIPHTQVEELAPQLLPETGAAIVTYCSSTECRNSEIAANQLTAMGYTNVRRYTEGKQDWVEAGLPVENGALT